MAGCAHAIARRVAFARRALLVAAFACGVIGLQSLPTAAAAKDGASTTVAPASEPTAASTRRAERAAARAEAAAPTPAAAPAPAPAPGEVPPALPVPLHGHHGVPGAHAPASPPAQAPPLAGNGNGAGAGAASRGADRPLAAARARRREERRGQTTTAAASAEPPSTSESDSAAANAQSLARTQKKAKKEKEKEKTKAKGKEGHKEKGKKGTSPGEEPKPGEEPGEESSGGATVAGKAPLESLAEPAEPTAVVAAVSAPVAAVAAPAGGTGTASIDSLAASFNPQPGSAASRSARTSRRAGRKSATATAVAGTAAATPLVSLPASGTPGTADQATHAAKKTAHKSSSQPAIVKTITRLVGVVPTPIRILILALGVLALALGVRSLFSGVRTRRLVRQRGELLEDVGALQAALLPVPPGRLGPVGTSVAYRPADGPGAGGDFYDVFALEDGRLAVIVGDVSGHGREALPHTALVRFTVRAYLEAGLAPGKALQTAGSVLERQLAGSFATVVVAIYHPRERTLTYASAGHPPPVVLGEAAAASVPTAISLVTSCTAPPVGAGTRTGTRETVISVPGPARLCFHTDGVTEARIAGELFGAERLTELLQGLDPDADASALLDGVTQQSDARPDDMAACLLRVQDGAGEPSVVFEQLELDKEAAANPRAERFLLDCGVPAAQAALLMRRARAQLEHSEMVLLELRLGAGDPVVSLHGDNVIHPVALAAASAS